MSRVGDVLILGLGSSGTAAARYCVGLPEGEATSVTAYDAADTPILRQRAAALEELGVTVVLGGSAITGHYDLCIASPGIPPHADIMIAARTASSRMVSEIEFAYSRSSCPWVAVTGTNGKTTTTALLSHLLNSAGMPSRPVGNYGPPAIEAVEDAQEGEVLVAEVSSFQLALTETFHPRAAVLLNITPDHLDWHGSFGAYASDKAKVFANLTDDDVAIIDVDDAGSAPYADAAEAQGINVVRVSKSTEPGGRAAFVVGGELCLSTPDGPIALVAADELLIRGPHNVSNALAAASAAHMLGVSTSDLRWGLRSFEPIEHRLEPAGEACGAEWFNDSKATNPDAVFKAIASFEGSDVIVLLGGRNKGNDFRPLAQAVSETCRGAVLFGEARAELKQAFDGLSIEIRQATGLEGAVRVACELATPGSAVVLSPACASFDEFSNYEERGRAFKRLVSELTQEVAT